MDEPKSRLWTIVITAVGTSLTLLAIIVGIINFLRTEQDNIEIEGIKRHLDLVYEYDREQADQKRATYRSIAELVGKIANASPKELPALRRQFLDRYWGSLLLIPIGASEESELADYRALLLIYHPEQEQERNRLKSVSQNLVESLRKSIEADRDRLDRKEK